MKIHINGDLFTTTANNIAELITEQTPEPPFVIAVNGDFVPKSQYLSATLNAGDTVDIVAPIFGG